MLADERSDIRRLALQIILRARNNLIPQRKFQVHKLNFNANSYEDIISWQDEDRTEPPITKHILTETIQKGSRMVSPPCPHIPRFPCHTQSVERTVKVVTDVFGNQNRHRDIQGIFRGRSVMHKFETKRDFKAAF